MSDFFQLTAKYLNRDFVDMEHEEIEEALNLVECNSNDYLDCYETFFYKGKEFSFCPYSGNEAKLLAAGFER